MVRRTKQNQCRDLVDKLHQKEVSYKEFLRKASELGISPEARTMITRVMRDHHKSLAAKQEATTND